MFWEKRGGVPLYSGMIKITYLTTRGVRKNLRTIGLCRYDLSPCRPTRARSRSDVPYRFFSSRFRQFNFCFQRINVWRPADRVNVKVLRLLAASMDK